MTRTRRTVVIIGISAAACASGVAIAGAARAGDHDPAHATRHGSTVSHRVQTDPHSAATYWTRDRMQHAKPD